MKRLLPTLALAVAIGCSRDSVPSQKTMKLPEPNDPTASETLKLIAQERRVFEEDCLEKVMGFTEFRSVDQKFVTFACSPNDFRFHLSEDVARGSAYQNNFSERCFRTDGVVEVQEIGNERMMFCNDGENAEANFDLNETDAVEYQSLSPSEIIDETLSQCGELGLINMEMIQEGNVIHAKCE